ncbi:MAG: hypothetical protein E6Z25_07290, partial [Negativicoccus succinicivorans]|uniref:hypothetical protein n=1 Tax=Negativicoccus succinicivorans TaxID=620903 RepID=UPI0029112E2B
QSGIDDEHDFIVFVHLDTSSFGHMALSYKGLGAVSFDTQLIYYSVFIFTLQVFFRAALLFYASVLYNRHVCAGIFLPAERS